LRQIEPHLTALPGLSALWLGGSAARDDADAWSSVDLHLLLRMDGDVSQTAARLSTLLDGLFPAGWTEFAAPNQPSNSIEGFTHSRAESSPQEGAVYFRLLWTTPDDLTSHRARHGPVRLLWAADDLPAARAGLLFAPVPALQAADASAVQAGLIGFWQMLAHLPAAINRREELAAAALLHNARQHLTDLVVALNGATRPPTPARINRYLGPAQQDAFEKSLGQNPGQTLGAEGWIGQAVALIVLYRWYAPQLVEIHKLIYPTALEKTVLALLSTEVSGWPAQITTA